MKERYFWIAFPLLGAVAVGWLVRNTSLQQTPSLGEEVAGASAPADKAVSLVAIPIVRPDEPEDPDDNFYIFDNGSETDFAQGSQGFGAWTAIRTIPW